jgi:catechol 2,3-dioxygenase-like lactoylglutathione lyase family enzyme
MLVSNLDHLNLSVNNFDETVEWYNKIFGFKLVEQGVQDGSNGV